ncbi:unnamed protein product [Didymodactylos carnosus]|uniref:Uncharacterized protein n=1 Tax=Didymodactylos carnosus TaxID=1234261 RepID=A0A813SVD1_9BILA|nr:unnamed protein product [Didymodactylos carnosus]CAF1380597.1 unnamed protein product [Didymodactylos carnosus]CAF3587552.1 unnamed protein product [Didymodactylos carnosus]CAF4188947.1 unnamed protein product [Didymodactylos carnosus]
MTEVVSPYPYCTENSTNLTRPGSQSFYCMNGSSDETVIDKHQAKRLYRLQRAPSFDEHIHLEKDEQQDYQSILRRQIGSSCLEPPVYILKQNPDTSNSSMRSFSLGKSRLDPPRINPKEVTTVRGHPSTEFGHDHVSINGNVRDVPRWNNRLVADVTLRGRLGPGGTLNPEEDCKQAHQHLMSRTRSLERMSLNDSISRSHQRPVTDGRNRDELARSFMYTSAQQSAWNEVNWDSKLAPKLPLPITTYEDMGSDPVLKKKTLASLNDSRTHDLLEWDRFQPRKTTFYRKPIANVAPLPRANQISGYSGTIGGQNIHDIDDPTANFTPFTVLRTEQPKFAMNPFQLNIPFYTGRYHWTKTTPVTHYDQFGRPYTTTAAFHKPLPVDYGSYRFAGQAGDLSSSVTTVVPHNPFNQLNVNKDNSNNSLDTRISPIIIQQTQTNTSNINEAKKIQDSDKPSKTPPGNLPASQAPENENKAV